MKKIFLAVVSCAASVLCIAQSNSVNLSKTKDSTLKAMILADSLKIGSKFAKKKDGLNCLPKKNSL